MKHASNVFLVGLMGAGKTTVGRHLARRLSKEFLDTDHEIETRTGVRVAVIFEIEGESGFRRREAETLSRLVETSNIVLATGGGVILDPNNRELLKQHGCVVYLHAKPLELAKRIGQDRTRPLLQGTDPRKRLEELYLIRDPLYREIADLIIDTGRQSVSTLVGQLVARLEAECKPIA